MEIDYKLMANLMAAVQSEESNLAVAKARLDDAHMEFDLASSRFAAVRDLFKRRLGKSPYSADMKAKHKVGTLLDEYRFLDMNPTDAAVEVLQDANSPIPLDVIVERLRVGGLGVPGLFRSVNAGLMNRAGVVKDTDGMYHFDQGIIDDAWELEE